MSCESETPVAIPCPYLLLSRPCALLTRPCAEIHHVPCNLALLTAGSLRHVDATLALPIPAADRSKQGSLACRFMGMGEPLANIDAVLAAIDIVCHPKGLQLSAKKVPASSRVV